MKSVLEVKKQENNNNNNKICADMPSISISEMSWMSILRNLVENSRIPSLKNNSNEIGRTA